MQKYRLKKQYRRKVTALPNGIRIDDDFFNRYKGANDLIEKDVKVGHFFEDMEGKPVTEAEKPVAKDEPKPKAAEEKEEKPAKKRGGSKAKK